MNPRPPVLLIALAAFAAPLAPAIAQSQSNPLDTRQNTSTRRDDRDGRLLDRNLRVGGDGKNETVRDFEAMRRFNDAVIYGQASGGKSFRDNTVESRDPFEFRGSLSTDSLYRFRRDSAASGLASRGIRSSDALSYQLALSSGKPVAAPISLQLLPERLGRSSTGASVSAMRSITQYEWEQSRRPSVLGYSADRGGRGRVLTASTLRGVATSFATDNAGETLLSGLERSAVGVVRSQDMNARLAARPVSSRIETRVPSAYDEVLKRFKQEGGYADQTPGADKPATPSPDGRGADQPSQPPKPQWERDLDDLRERVRERQQRAPDAAPAEPAADAAQQAAEREARARKLVERLRRLRAATALPDLGGDEQGLTVYASVVREGQARLAEGRYLDAEAVFNQLLVTYPGDAMATAGRAHSQIGAGAYLSAAATLRGLFESSPEMIPIRFAGRAMISPARQAEVAAALTAELARPGSAIPADASLLLAYLGHQADNADWLKAGLEGLAKYCGEGTPDHALARTLTVVWSPVEPAPAPEPGK
jgi:hypothetical protein